MGSAIHGELSIAMFDEIRGYWLSDGIWCWNTIHKMGARRLGNQTPSIPAMMIIWHSDRCSSEFVETGATWSKAKAGCDPFVNLVGDGFVYIVLQCSKHELGKLSKTAPQLTAVCCGVASPPDMKPELFRAEYEELTSCLPEKNGRRTAVEMAGPKVAAALGANPNNGNSKVCNPIIRRSYHFGFL